MDFRQEFIEFAVSQNVLRFGEFRTKAGRLSPYFFNAGLFNDGASLNRLAQFYAKAILASDLGRRCCSARPTRAFRWLPRRRWRWRSGERTCRTPITAREAKDHGEGGTLVGAPLSGRVLIVDDVISAGTSVRESVELIRAAGPAHGVVIALDRMERGTGALSAVQEVQRDYGIRSSPSRRWKTCSPFSAVVPTCAPARRRWPHTDRSTALRAIRPACCCLRWRSRLCCWRPAILFAAPTSTGKQVCGDILPKACPVSAYREINQNGMTVRQVEAPLTAEQRSGRKKTSARKRKKWRQRRAAPARSGAAADLRQRGRHRHHAQARQSGRDRVDQDGDGQDRGSGGAAKITRTKPSSTRRRRAPELQKG